MRLCDRVAIITGGGRGIGEAIALTFAGEGARLVLAARTEAEVGEVAARIRTQGGAAESVRADVANPDDVTRLVDTALAAYGRIDVLVNAAGVYGPIGPTWDVPAEAWLHAMQVNLGGTFLCCRAVVPHMIKVRRGRIINFSGGGAAAPLPRFSAYGVSKAAIVRLTETLAEELKNFNIQVNAIAPGAVATKIQDDVLAAGERAGDLLPRILRLRETGEGGVPRELPAQLALFLASDDSFGLTGKLIAAPHDGWESWDEQRIAALMSAPWFTLRRLDPLTLRPFLGKLRDDVDWG